MPTVSTLLLIVAFVAVLALVSWACEQYGPLLVLGGILLVAVIGGLA